MRSWMWAGSALALVISGSLAVSAQRPRPEAAMATAATNFLGSLTPAQKEKAVFPFSSPERLDWHFIPRPRKGLPLKEMTPAQRELALALVKSSASPKAGEQTATIRSLENILKEQEKGSGPVRDPELYFFSVFGEPSENGTWGWRYEGHHCALNWTVVAGKGVAAAPQFFGSNPAEVKDGPMKGTRVLAAEEDLALALVNSLTPEQKKQAVVKEAAPADIANNPTRKQAMIEEKGISRADLNPDQQKALLALIQEYVRKQPQAVARRRMQALNQAGVDQIRFVWMGPTARDQKAYYAVYGPTFVIEYDNTNGNHIHSVWRDVKGDFGVDLLAMHYRASPHRLASARISPARP